jgi:heat shock protein HslJ
MFKLQSKPLFWVFLASFSIFLGGCAQVMPTCTAVNAPPSRDMLGSQWELIRWHYTSPNDGKTRLRGIPHRGNGEPITLNISADGKTASGSSGCNLYTAQVASSDWGFLLEKIVSTRKACNPHMTELEYKFLSYLADYRTMVRDGDRLLIMTRDGEVLSFGLKN